jgi:sugar phosphate permease
VCFGLLAIGAYHKYSSHFFFISIFFFIGLSQSFLFPTLVSIIGSWFSQKHRGIITGSWGTCTNVGNIVGFQLAALLLHHKEKSENWHVLMIIVSVVFIANCIMILTVYQPYPASHDLIIDKQETI